MLIERRGWKNKKLRWSYKKERTSWNSNVSLLRLRHRNARKLLRLSNSNARKPRCIKRQLSNSNARKLWRLRCVKRQFSNGNARKQQRRREDFEKQERECTEILDMQFRREVAEAAERK